MKYLKTRSLLKFIHRTLKVLKEIFNETRTFVSVMSTIIKIQQYNRMIELLFYLINNFEIQKWRCCVFIIYSELVFLKQQAYDIATKIETFRNNFIKFELFKIFNLKNADAQLTNIQSLTFKNLNKTAIDALLLQISLSFKFKIIKFEKIKVYKSQSENEHQR